MIPGETVLILGTGGVSIFAAQFAQLAGCNVIVTSSSDEKIERCKKELGVIGGVNYRKVKEWNEEVVKINGGRGVGECFTYLSFVILLAIKRITLT